jgi:hypothetical protein
MTGERKAAHTPASGPVLILDAVVNPGRPAPDEVEGCSKLNKKFTLAILAIISSSAEGALAAVLG